MVWTGRMGPRWRSRRLGKVTGALAAALGMAVAGVACTPNPAPGSVVPAAASPAPEPEAPLSLSIGPEAGAKGLPVSTEITIALTGGQVTSVVLTRSGTTDAVPGQLRDDGTSWVPSRPLAFNTTYDVTVTASSADGGRTETATTSFTTMGRFARTTGTGLYLFDGQTVGVAMPVVVEFVPPVPKENRAAVQRRLFVTTDPPQPGAWYWPSGSQAWYRAPNYWQPGTKISVRAALYGVPMGGGRYGDTDRSATATVGSQHLMVVDNADKQMRVYHDGELVRKMPVSLGKKSTPSSSGLLVVMSKHSSHTFDTRGDPGVDQYVVNVRYAMRLTWGGEFIHAAPWSVGDQGRRNVSHGCINMSVSNSAWLFENTYVGDPILIKGTEVKVADGNGWTAWNHPWPEYVKGSALPVPPELAAMKGVDPRTGYPPKDSPRAVKPTTD